MVFINKDNNKPDTLIYFGTYIPKGRFPQEHAQDSFSPFILRMKNGEDEMVERAVRFFDEKLLPNIAVAVVPSSTADKDRAVGNVHGMTVVARRLATFQGRIDATRVLVRHTSVPKAHLGGGREAGVHQRSVTVNLPPEIARRPILLIDDITTSGSSIRVCRKMLMDAGARYVQMVAIGKTRS